MNPSSHAAEIANGNRFEFGSNWQRYLRTLTDEKVEHSMADLRQMLQISDLKGKTFLDVGSGSGLSSLAARRLGAKVYSFDYDPQSVACTRYLRDKYFPGDADWTIDEASALDSGYMSSLGQFDVVYSWGVLHHTGQMWQGLQNALLPLKVGGKLFIAIYNYQAYLTCIHTTIKRTYAATPNVVKPLFVGAYATFHVAKGGAKDLLRFKNPLERYTNCDRGMGWWHDLIDWIGGYPFETASPGEIFNFFSERHCSLEQMTTLSGHGCNIFVFKKQLESNESTVGYQVAGGNQLRQSA